MPRRCGYCYAFSVKDITLKASGFFSKFSLSQSRQQPLQEGNLQKEIAEEGASGVQDQIVHVARAHHKGKLQRLNRYHNQDLSREEEEPFPQSGEVMGKEKGHGHKGADVSNQIQEGVVAVDVAVEKALDVDVIDAAEGNGIEEALHVGLSRAAYLTVD